MSLSKSKSKEKTHLGSLLFLSAVSETEGGNYEGLSSFNWNELEDLLAWNMPEQWGLPLKIVAILTIVRLLAPVQYSWCHGYLRLGHFQKTPQKLKMDTSQRSLVYQQFSSYQLQKISPTSSSFAGGDILFKGNNNLVSHRLDNCILLLLLLLVKSPRDFFAFSYFFCILVWIISIYFICTSQRISYSVSSQLF